MENEHAKIVKKTEKRRGMRAVVLPKIVTRSKAPRGANGCRESVGRAK